MKLDVLAIAAHPDDVELCCAGTLAALTQQGLRCGVLDLTQGEMGTRGTPEERLSEAQDAARILGLRIRENLGLPDNGLVNSRVHQDAIMAAVRRFQPEICFINAATDRHPDHGHAHKLISDTLFYSGLQKRETTAPDGSAQHPWRPKHVFMFMQDTPFEPDLVFDITETQRVKEEAILAFKTQFNVPATDDGPQTYISGEGFFEMIRSRARIFGHQIGVQYGEPFKYLGGPLPFGDFSYLLSHNRIR
ncbi:bacillithiol biosynthesis deacetylase BshB1 [Cyclonatronum proteinivorum]|uniref:Bacillithiol biosynthesis deacetylase BshB1 n=1 Tax=Cyclonatronum proteinivorum TaxID=1457365 RepID=A0A345UJ71_9BACT|nr:bacillithiol biosynthesis deacetylase BshB1 [Cyclonatronum proteinivorum]AXJ00523.1 bacillithiol biosynthesis deacetylase BshB1 [Cyclonatronum proteinivorum]